MRLIEEFLHRELIVRDFNVIERVDDRVLDEFVVRWATTKKPKPLQPAEEVLESLEASLPFSTYVWKLLTERVLEHRSVALRNSKG